MNIMRDKVKSKLLVKLQKRQMKTRQSYRDILKKRVATQFQRILEKGNQELVLNHQFSFITGNALKSEFQVKM